MKISKQKLKQIIKEELAKALDEADEQNAPGAFLLCNEDSDCPEGEMGEQIYRCMDPGTPAEVEAVRHHNQRRVCKPVR